MKNLLRLLVLFLFLLNLLPLSFASNNIYNLLFKKIDEKTFFYLNEELWFPKLAIYDPNSKYWKNQSHESNIETLIDYGFNALTIPITSEWVTNHEFIKDNIEPTLKAAQRNNLPVMIKFYVAIWEMLPEWKKDASRKQYMMMLPNGTFIQYPDYASKQFIDEYLSKIDKVIDYTERYENVVAYILEDSDFWSIPEDVEEYSGGLHSLETTDTFYPYNLWIKADFINWLELNNFSPQELCLDSLEEAYLPTSLENATSTNHWLAWKEYRREGYTLKTLEKITQHIRDKTSKPIGMGVDIGYRYNDMDQRGMPIPELDKVFDFVNAYLGWEPSWMSTWRGCAILDLLKIPVIGFFDVYWEEVYPELYITGISPYVSGYQVALPIVDDLPNLYLLDEISKSINYVEENELYKTYPVKPKTTILTSIENAMYAGQSFNPYANSDPYHFSQNGYYGILTRNGIPVSFVHESNKITEYPVTIAGATTEINTFSSRYTAITEKEIQDYLNNGNLFIKGPYPIRAEPPITLRLGEYTESQSSMTIIGDWSEPENIDGIVARWTGINSEIKCPVTYDTAYELKITFKDIYHEDQNNKLWIEIQTPTGFKKIQETYYPGCFLLNVWREISYMIPNEILTRPETTIRLVGDESFPISQIELTPLSTLSPIPETMIYNWPTQLMLPSGSFQDLMISPLESPDPITEYLESLEGDTTILEGNNEGLGYKGNLIVKRPIREGSLIKLGFELGAEWFRNIMEHGWSYRGYFNKPLEELLTSLLLVKPDIKLYDVMNCQGENINDQIICIPVKSQIINETKIIILNPTNTRIEFTLDLNPKFFDPMLEGNYYINETIEPYQATAVNYEPDIILIDCINLEKERANKGESQKIEIHAVWSRNNKCLDDGIVSIDNRKYSFNETGWVNVEINEGDFLQIIYRNSQVFKYSDPTKPLWDTVLIELNLSDTRIDVGKEAHLNINAYYTSDNKEFDGEITLSEGLAQGYVGLKTIKVASITDSEYGITSFKSNTVECIWDQVIITESDLTKENPVPGETVTYWVKAKYQYDSTVFDDSKGTLYLDGVPMEWSNKNNRWETKYTSDVETTLHPKITDIFYKQYNLTNIKDFTTPIEIQYRNKGIPSFTLIQITISLVLSISILRMKRKIDLK